MTTPRRFFGLSPARLPALIVAGIAAVAGIVFAYLRLFYDGKLPRALSLRRVDDLLALSVLVALVALYLFARPDTEPAAKPARRRFNWRVAIPLAGLIFVAMFLRLHGLGFQSLWYDELASAQRTIGSDLFEAVAPTGRLLDSWPAFHIPLFLFTQGAGITEFALRFPSALMGILAIPAVYVLGRRMFSDVEGLLGAALITGMQGAIEYSQEARMYALLMFLGALCGYFWFRLAEALYRRQEPPKMVTFGLTATLILMIYSHHYGVLMMAISGLGALAVMWSVRRVSVGWLAAFAAAGVSYAPWLPMLYQDLHNKTFRAQYVPASLIHLADEFGRFLAGSGPLAYFLALLCGCGVVYGLVDALRHRERRTVLLALSPVAILGVWLIAPILIAYFRSLVATPIVQYRYFLVTLPALALLAGHAIARLPVGRTGLIAAGVGLPLLLAAGVFLDGYYVTPRKTQFHQAMQYVLSHDQQYPDSVIAMSWFGTTDQIVYYFRLFGSRRSVDMKLSPPAIDESHQRILDANTRYAWVIGEEGNFDPGLLDVLTQDYTRLDSQRYYNIGVWLFERKTPAP